ncbi:putative inorganic phosphate transporter PHO87 [Colletotrichum sublineola]|uniref:Putative inorganic phosphate transporter PHO87 n=1 Tax=Colletotrichum sublineola TaxID=1173701 RepID=A0A066XGT6_COLSU|nr:putative inorganic phosphate transporter PHO87 [Colletotrichum sublineola]
MFVDQRLDNVVIPPDAASPHILIDLNQPSAGLGERGGSSTTNNNSTVAQTQSYELANYNHITARKTAKDHEDRLQQKRLWKRQWLEEQDDMKFSHSIQFNAVPDWSSHYIAYSNLKKL